MRESSGKAYVGGGTRTGWQEKECTELCEQSVEVGHELETLGGGCCVFLTSL